MVVLDLEDDCVKDERLTADKRVTAWRGSRNIRVEVVFLNREYETLFLQATACLGDIAPQSAPNNPETVRGAKERVKQMIGRRYKETQDQVRFTQQLDLKALYPASRAFRRFCKALCGEEYKTLAQSFS